MKKLLSLVLALALTLSLAAPALAAEAQEPYWKTVGYASLEEMLDDGWADSAPIYYANLATPAERAAFVAAYRKDHAEQSQAFDYDTAYAVYLDTDYTQAEVLEMLELSTQAQLDDLLFCLWLEEQDRAQRALTDWADLQAEQPERVALFLAQLDDFLQDEWGYDLAQVMETFDFTSLEEAYLSFFEDWNASYQEEQEAAAQRSALITSLGGVPGQINVMAGRRCLSFGGKPPKLVDGALSVPADVLATALGAQVKGDAEGYAPLRSTAEAAGWDVLWDQEHQTALLLNRAGLTADLDKQFTQLNTLFTRLFAAVQSEAGQSYRTQGEVAFSFTLFDSLDGDKTYDLRLIGDFYHKDSALSGTLTLDLSSLVNLLTADQVKALFGKSFSLSKLTSLVKNCTAEFILNPETETLYIKMPMLAQLMEGKVPALGGWISLPMSGYGSMVDQSAPAPLSVGALIYDQAITEADSYWSGGAIHFYTKLDQLSQHNTAILGNARFTEQNGTLTYRMDTKTANALGQQYLLEGETWYGDVDVNLFKSCDVTLSVGQSGKITAKADVRLSSAYAGLLGSGYYPYDSGDFQFRLDALRTAESLKAGLDFHWQNRFTFTLTETDTIQKTDTAPLSAPPQGAEVVDINTLSGLISASWA